MRRLAIAFMMIGNTALAFDVCSSYGAIHEREILPRIKSGIPFKLLSLAADDRQTYRRVVRVEYDLWDEVVTAEIIGRNKTTSSLKDSAKALCNALSLPEVKKGKIQYRLLLNPVLGEGLQSLKSKIEDKSGLLEINWERLAKDLGTEKTLIESEIKE